MQPTNFLQKSKKEMSKIDLVKKIKKQEIFEDLGEKNDNLDMKRKIFFILLNTFFPKFKIFSPPPPKKKVYFTQFSENPLKTAP